jgi:hypothetical protein
LSRQFSGSGLGASAAPHAPTRKPTAAPPAPCGFGRERRRGAGRFRSRKSGADCIAKFGNSNPVAVNTAVNTAGIPSSTEPRRCGRWRDVFQHAVWPSVSN